MLPSFLQKLLYVTRVFVPVGQLFRSGMTVQTAVTVNTLPVLE